MGHGWCFIAVYSILLQHSGNCFDVVKELRNPFLWRVKKNIRKKKNIEGKEESNLRVDEEKRKRKGEREEAAECKADVRGFGRCLQKYDVIVQTRPERGI
jgi:hypothetical protein